MKILQKIWNAKKSWSGDDFPRDFSPQLVFVFGDTKSLTVGKTDDVKSWFPYAQIVYISTAGFIYKGDVIDDSILVTALEFKNTLIKCISHDVADPMQSESAGSLMASRLDKEGLKHVMLFSEGLIVRGAELVKGVNAVLSQFNVVATGGLAGDWPSIEKTFVGLNEKPSGSKVIMIGLYGDSIRVGYGSFGGWDIFGPERIITRARGNVLYELDGKPALAIYKEYLGEKAKDLPLSGLLFPLQVGIPSPDGLDYVVRNLIGINEEDGGMIFAAGDMVEGATVRMMKGNFDRLIDGASSAASMSLVKIGDTKVDFAFLVSCMGRRMVLKDRIVEEIDAVIEAIDGNKPVITGFYSYAEICPVTPTEHECRLHNQTMTITTLAEV